MAWKCRKERAHWETWVQSGSKQEERSTYCEIHDCEVVLNSGMTLRDWHNWQQGHTRWQQWFFLFSNKFAESDSLNWAHSKKVWLFSCYVCVKKFKAGCVNALAVISVFDISISSYFNHSIRKSSRSFHTATNVHHRQWVGLPTVSYQPMSG